MGAPWGNRGTAGVGCAKTVRYSGPGCVTQVERAAGAVRGLAEYAPEQETPVERQRSA